MTHPANLFTGQHVRLRAVEPSDWEAFDEWNDDTQAAREAYFIPFPRGRDAQQRWTAERALDVPKDDAFRFIIARIEDNAPVGTLNTHTCDARNGTFMYGLAIGSRHRRKGYAAEAIRLVLRYYFEELRYQKVTVEVYAFNEASIRLHERQGFTLEGRLRRMVYTGGSYHDVLLFGLTAEEFAARPS